MFSLQKNFSFIWEVFLWFNLFEIEKLSLTLNLYTSLHFEGGCFLNLYPSSSLRVLYWKQVRMVIFHIGRFFFSKLYLPSNWGEARRGVYKWWSTAIERLNPLYNLPFKQRGDANVKGKKFFLLLFLFWDQKRSKKVLLKKLRFSCYVLLISWALQTRFAQTMKSFFSEISQITSENLC